MKEPPLVCNSAAVHSIPSKAVNTTITTVSWGILTNWQRTGRSVKSCGRPVRNCMILHFKFDTVG